MPNEFTGRISDLQVQDLVPFPPLTPSLNVHTLQHPPLQILISHVHAHKRPVRRVEIKRFDCFPDLQYLIGWQGDHVGY